MGNCKIGEMSSVKQRIEATNTNLSFFKIFGFSNEPISLNSHLCVCCVAESKVQDNNFLIQQTVWFLFRLLFPCNHNHHYN